MKNRKFQPGDLVYLKEEIKKEDYEREISGCTGLSVKFEFLPKTNKLEVVERVSTGNVGISSGEILIALRGVWYREEMFELFQP